MRCLVHLDPRYAWSEEQYKGLTLRYAGRRASVFSVATMLDADSPPLLKSLDAGLAALPGHYAACISGKDWTLLLADKVSSYSLFYAVGDGHVAISNSARLLAVRCGLAKPDREALTEFRMASYVTGSDTLVSGLAKLQAGEVALCTPSGLERCRYYQFYSSEVRLTPERELIAELEEVTNAVFDRVIEDLHGRRIIVPLSGGLDSRVVLCKLKERGAKDMLAFSYGSPGNRDSLAAKDVAYHLDIPWEFVPTSWSEARRIFYSDLRRQYWRYADQLHIVPNLHTFYSLATLFEQERLSGNPVFVNGQSGDFICGNHIPNIPATEAGQESFIRAIAAKHYSHNRVLSKEMHFLEFVALRVKKVLGDLFPMPDLQELAKFWELWEWQARQSVRVVHGQRNYDFFGSGWELPLWEVEYLRFFQNLPLEHKFGRSLFRRWLEHYDFYGLFRTYTPRASRWTRGRGWIEFLGRAITAILGRRFSAKWYAAMDCFSQYDYLYAPSGHVGYWRGIREFRSPMGFMAQAWEKENQDVFVEAI